MTLFILVVFALTLSCGYALRRYGPSLGFMDIPNERSTHKVQTLRAGGVLFIIAIALLHLVLFVLPNTITVLFFIISLLALADDRFTLPVLVRLIPQLVVMGILVWVSGIHTPLLFLLCLIGVTGFINTVNFMDGINGISVTFFLSAIVLFHATSMLDIVNFPMELLVGFSIGVLIFTWFNFRKKALMFAGDVGSVGGAFIVAALTIQLMMETHSFIWILLALVYGVDSVATIIFRLRRKENIFKPHRQHLYQRIVDSRNVNHLVLSTIYGLIQLFVNAILLWAWVNHHETIIGYQWSITISVIVLVFAIYGVIRRHFEKSAVSLNT